MRRFGSAVVVVVVVVLKVRSHHKLLDIDAIRLHVKVANLPQTDRAGHVHDVLVRVGRAKARRGLAVEHGLQDELQLPVDDEVAAKTVVVMADVEVDPRVHVVDVQVVGEHEEAVPGAVGRLQGEVAHGGRGVAMNDLVVLVHVDDLEILVEVETRVVLGHARDAQRVANVVVRIGLAGVACVRVRAGEAHVQLAELGEPPGVAAAAQARGVAGDLRGVDQRARELIVAVRGRHDHFRCGGRVDLRGGVGANGGRAESACHRRGRAEREDAASRRRHGCRGDPRSVAGCSALAGGRRGSFSLSRARWRALSLPSLSRNK